MRPNQTPWPVRNYRNGGMISGPGTGTSDEVPAEVLETKEPLAVSNGERIVSVAQDRFLQGVAEGMGHESVDDMLEKGTGKPVGPTLKYVKPPKESKIKKAAKGKRGRVKHADLGGSITASAARPATGTPPEETMREKYEKENVERAKKNLAPKPATAPSLLPPKDLHEAITNQKVTSPGFGLGGLIDSAKRAVGMLPPQTMREKYAQKDAELAAKNPAPKPATPPPAAPAAPASAPAPSVQGGLDGAGGRSVDVRMKAAGLANGGLVVSATAPEPLPPKDLQEDVANRSFDSMSTIATKERLGGVDLVNDTQLAINDAGHRVATPGFNLGGLIDSAKRAVGMLPPQTMREKYAQKDAELAAKNPAPKPATPPPAAPAAPASAPAPSVQGGLDGAGGRSVDVRMKAAGLANGGLIRAAAEGKSPEPTVMDRLTVPQEAWGQVAQQRGDAQYNDALRGAQERIDTRAAQAGRINALAAKEQAAFGARQASGVARATAGAPAASQAYPDESQRAPAVNAGPVAASQAYPDESQRAPAVNAAPVAAAAAPTGLLAAAKRTDTGIDDGRGNTVARYDVAGKSPLFTNMHDAAGMVSNEKLLARGAITPENMTAADNLDAKYQREAQNTNQRVADAAQVAAETAQAQAINRASAIAADAISNRVANERAKWDADLKLSSNLAKKEEKAAAMRSLDALNTRQLEAVRNEGAAIRDAARDAISQRDHDSRGRQFDANHAIAQGAQKLAQNKDAREAATFAQQQEALARVKSLMDAYHKAAPADRPALAEQIRVMQGKEQAARYKTTALQAVKNADGSTSPGMVVTTNEQTGETRVVDPSAGAGNLAADPKALAIKADPKMTTDQKKAALAQLGYK